MLKKSKDTALAVGDRVRITGTSIVGEVTEVKEDGTVVLAADPPRIPYERPADQLERE